MFLTIFLVSLFLLTSCSDTDNSSYGELLDRIQEELDEGERDFERYIAVVPADASAKVYGAVEDMARKIGRNTETETLVVYDYEKISVSDGDCEILIGDTLREESQIFLRGYRADDYGYRYSDGKIFVGGICESATLRAIEKFTNDVVDYADRELFMSRDKSYFYVGEYPIGRITLNGFEICDYTLLYDSSDTLSYGTAVGFRDKLAERSGYYLRIRDISDAHKSLRAICVGNTERLPSGVAAIEDSEACLFSYSSGVCIAAENRFGYTIAADKLISMLCEVGADGASAVTVDGSLAMSFLSSEFCFFRIFPSVSELSPTQSVAIADKMIEYGADFISVYGVSELSAERVRMAAGENFGKILVGGDSRSGAYHIYPSERLSLIGTSNAEGAESGIVFLRYKANETEAEFLIAEVIPTDRGSVSDAGIAAESLAESDIFVDNGAILINSCFNGDADSAFGAALSQAERIGEKNSGRLTGYISGIAASVNFFDTASDNAAEYECYRIRFYK